MGTFILALKNYFVRFVFLLAYNHNLVKVYMECDYTHLNHNSIVSQKKVVTKGMIIQGVHCTYPTQTGWVFFM